MLKGRVPLILAGVLGLLAALVAYLTIQQRTSHASERWKPIAVLAAKEDLSAGEVLSKKNMTTIEVPRAIVTQSVITVEDWRKGTPVEGRKLAMDIRKNDIILYQHIHAKAGGQHLAEAVQKEFRAVSIRVNPESAVHHWIEPGDRVDVLGVFREPRSGDMISITMLQNVIVLATGRIAGQTNMRLLSEAERAFNTVTLHVAPTEAEMLVLAQDLGTLYLSLRSASDDDVINVADARTTMETLTTGERTTLARRRSSAIKVEVIRGSRTEMQTLP